ncbi:50S ribosomal protein L4 [Candidatus Woesearchaeota archaeon]|nr:50S ribosomal protein L4 [Candidatus Woesearchaeota archaeon]
MKLPVYTLAKEKTKERNLPVHFNEEYRPDLIKRAVLALQSAAQHVYGAYPNAGQRHSSKTRKRRRDYRGTYGFGISRAQRKILSRRGMRMFWVGATSPQTVGGRRSHPPKVEKILQERINKKENRKAIRSAIGATINKGLVAKRGHKVPAEYPFIVDSDVEKITKTKELQTILEKFGLVEELARSSIKKIRSGRGKLRGRRYHRKKGPLIVVSGECPLSRAGKNIAGVDVVAVKSLNAVHLAPGSLPGRLTLWTEGAIEVLENEKLFL